MISGLAAAIKHPQSDSWQLRYHCWSDIRGRSGYVIACYIALCAAVSIIATLLMPDHTNKDISQERA